MMAAGLCIRSLGPLWRHFLEECFLVAANIVGGRSFHTLTKGEAVVKGGPRGHSTDTFT